MTLLNANLFTDLADHQEDGLQKDHVSGHLACSSSVSSGQQDVQGAESPVVSASVPEKLRWVDLCDPDPSQLAAACQAFHFPSTMRALCLRRFHTPTVTRIDSALFLTTFFTALSPETFFSLQELKICGTPRMLLTVHRRATTAPFVWHILQPELERARDDSSGSLLCLILEGAVRSYEAVGVELRKCLLRRTARGGKPKQGEERQRQQIKERGLQFVQFLRHQRPFLHEVKRLGKGLFASGDLARLRWLTERVGVMTRILEEIVQMSQNARGSVEQELRVILTEREKHTALIGGHFSFRRFTAVDLSHAVFHEADLQGAKFVKASLRGAVFHQANLHGAVFSFCDLQEADFTDARLEGTDFHTSYGLSLAMRRYIRSHGGTVEEGGDRERSSSREA